MSGDEGVPVLESVAQTGRSPKTLLIEWANSQDGWTRLLVAEVLAIGQDVPISVVADVYSGFKAEKGLTDEAPPPSPKLEIDDDNGNGEIPLVLLSLDKVHGVNALEDDQVIEFNRHLTLLYGQNGAGKTGYSRVLKRAAKVRSAEPILPNAHAQGPQPTPSARIRFTLDDVEGEVLWENEEGIAPFSRLSVFDWLSVTIHLDDKLGYLYTPAELSLFTYVSDGIERLQGLLAAESIEMKPEANQFLRHFAQGTSVYPLIENLGPATDLSELNRTSRVSSKDKRRRQHLAEEVAALKGKVLEDQIFAAEAKSSGLGLLSDAAKAASEFNESAYEAARSTVETVEAEYKRSRRELFDSADLEGDPDDEWQAFILAADTYREHLNLDHYPEDDDRCIYCRQTFSDDALRLVRLYRTFLDDSLSRQLASATKQVDEHALSIQDLDLPQCKRFLTSIRDDSDAPKWTVSASKAIKRLQMVAKNCAEGRPSGDTKLASDGAKLLPKILKSATTATTTEAALKVKKDDRGLALSTGESELAEIEARIELSKHLPEIKAHVDNSKAHERFEKTGQRIPGVRRSLTVVAKVASQDLVNSSFSKLFVEECEALRTPNVELQFAGRKGKAERRKTVAATYQPSDILSEGEQKVIALADYLAECRMRGTRAPVVFDDPVSSLDYRRVKEVAARIARLADTHQVVVFTHNIWFTTELLSLFDKRKDQIAYFSVRDNENAKGLITAGDNPRQDNPKTIGKRISSLIEAAVKADATAKEALIEKGYDLLRSWIEVFVEQEMLGGVTERYRPNVMMGKLSSIKTDKLDEAIEQVNSMFDRACRYMGGHSQPLEQLSVRPTLKELMTDWEAMQELRKSFV